MCNVYRTQNFRILYFLINFTYITNTVFHSQLRIYLVIQLLVFKVEQRQVSKQIAMKRIEILKGSK